MTDEQQQDSPVIKQLRDQLKAEKKARREAETRAEIAVQEARQQIRFDDTFEALGLPESVKDLVAGELGDREVSAESMQEAVSALGLDNFGPAETEDIQPSSVPDIASSLAEVSNLGNQVAQAANVGQGDNLTDRINAAETPEELSRIMAEAGQSGG